jgi:transcriptional regulator with XRE-family HTH domain
MLLVMSTHLAEMVRLWRAKNGLTQESAAALVGVSQGTLSRIESGHHFPDRATARNFVAAGAFTAAELGEAIVGGCEQAA